MRNIRMTLAYRGTAYHGWQVQQNARSVCTVFQDALEGVMQWPPNGKNWQKPI